MDTNSGFTELLLAAKAGDEDAMAEMFRMYKPLLIKNAMDKNVFNDDLYQELCMVLINCIQRYVI